jgi:ABC-type antimicrobial peptide transport system permease subunit
MKKSKSKPPKIAEGLLKLLANRRAQSAIIGDLEEEYTSLFKNRGKTHALLLYWKTIIISIPSFIKNMLYWSATMFKNYLKIAVRNVLRNKLAATINILGLAVGMACFILIALWMQDELSYDKFHTNKDELYLLTITHTNDIVDYNVPYALAPVLASEYPEILEYTRIYELDTMTCSFKYQRQNGQQVKFYEDNFILVDPCFFSMFTFPLIQGDPTTALENPNSLILREEIAKKYFGEDNPMGKKLTFNNREDLIVTGVVRLPSNSHIQFDFLAPLEDDMATNWNWKDQSFVLMDNNVHIDDFRDKIVGAFNTHYPHNFSGTLKVDIMPMTKAHLSFGRMTYVYIFSVIAVFILFIACINYMNLATASFSSRAKEVGLRKVVGAKKAQLIYQFLGESTFMSSFSLILALFFVKMALPVLNNLTSKHLMFLSTQTPILYIFLFGLVFMVGIVSGSYPALFLTRIKPVDTLRASLHFKNNQSLFRVVSVVGQFTISVLLIVCTAVVFKQLNYVQNRPLGINTDYVLKLPFNTDLKRQYPIFRNELLRNPNILIVSAGQAVPYNDDYKTQGVEWNAKDPDFVPYIRYSITDADFIELFEMEIQEGRSFDRANIADRKNFVINQTAAKYMGMESPIGQRLKFWDQEGQIIGVVKDFHHVSLHREIMPHYFTINPRFSTNALKYIFVKINSVNIPDTMKYIQETLVKNAPNYPVEYDFLDQGLGALYQSEQKLGKIFTYFAILAIFISCLGIFGLSAFSAEQRTKEIGIRKILGSSVSGITFLLSKEFSRWVLLANIVAWPVAYYVMHKWLQNFAYRTDISVVLFLLAGVLSLVIAALPVGYQALKAATSNPVDALRYE